MTAIYDFNWYLMPVQHQRVFLVMLLRAQNATVLKAGSVEVDLNLFVTVGRMMPGTIQIE